MLYAPAARGRGRMRALQAISLALAAQHGWPFGWTLVEVDGVGHSSTKMFSASPVIEALRGSH